jgi:hypothetical protein
MKKNLFLLLLILSTFAKNELFAQNVNIGGDELTAALCHKWEGEYALMGGMKIDKAPGATDIIFEFKKDNSLIVSSAMNKQKAQGKWKFDPAKKQILLTVNGASRGNIVALKDKEFTLMADMKGATPDDPAPLQVVFRIKE